MKYLLFFILLIYPNSLFANYMQIDRSLSNAYNKIYHKFYKLSPHDQGLSKIKQIASVLNEVSDTPKINKKNKDVLNNLQYLNNEKIFSIKKNNQIKKVKKYIAQNPNIKKFSNILYLDNFLVYEDGTWYTYIFTTSYGLDNIADINDLNMEYNNISYDKHIIYFKGNKPYIIKDYKKIRLVSDDLLYGVPDKFKLLDLLRKYFKRMQAAEDLDQEIKAIRLKSDEISKSEIKKSDVIKSIYNYIIGNTQYNINYKMESYEPFSGIKTFKNKSGVCEGYVELMIFMLAFQGIDAKMQTGDVITASDFGEIGHAWVKIGHYYYDPTFDDPIGTNRTESDYEYYKLPRDLFYSNRFDEGITPQRYFATTLEFRKKKERENLASLYPIYKDKHYNILNEIAFRIKYDIPLKKQLEISDITKAVKANYHSKDMRFIQDGSTKKELEKLVYFRITNTPKDIEGIIKQLNYDLEEYILVQDKSGGELTYNLSKDYKFR